MCGDRDACAVRRSSRRNAVLSVGATITVSKGTDHTYSGRVPLRFIPLIPASSEAARWRQLGRLRMPRQRAGTPSAPPGWFAGCRSSVRQARHVPWLPRALLLPPLSPEDRSQVHQGAIQTRPATVECRRGSPGRDFVPVDLLEAVVDNAVRLVAHVDPDPSALGLDRGLYGRAATAERAEHHIARIRRRADDALEERERLLGRVAEPLPRLIAERRDVGDDVE
jgi:hypothetical protein